MTQQTAESIYVHSVHQTALCKVISEAVRGNVLLDFGSAYVALKVTLKAAD